MRGLQALFISSLLFSYSAQARIFSFGAQTFAAYFNVTGAQPSLGTSAVEGETSLPLTYDKGVAHALSGEFGVSYSSPRGNLRLGIEVIKPQDTDGMASNGSAELYRYDTQATVLSPKITLDITLHGDKTSRSYIAGFAGVSFLQLRNYYTMTQDGINQYPGLGNHQVEMSSQSTLVGGSLGYEAHFTDRTTIFLEFGYRQLQFEKLKYKSGGTSFEGPYADKQEALINGGGSRAQNYNGAFASLGFRFYL